MNDFQSEKMYQAVVITGSSRGIGRNLAEAFAKDSELLFVIARSKNDLESLKRAIENQTRVQPILCDLSQLEDLQRTVKEIQNELQKTQLRLSGIINNAAVFLPDDHPTAWETQFSVNLLAPVRLTLSLRQSLSKGSWVINISSTASLRPVPRYHAYSALKAALNYWTQALALDLAPHGIRVNAVLPGIVDTPIHHFHHLPINEKSKTVNLLAQMHPLGRIGTPFDIVRACEFLAHPDAEWITGSTLVIDGGLTLKS